MFIQSPGCVRSRGFLHGTAKGPTKICPVWGQVVKQWIIGPLVLLLAIPSLAIMQVDVSGSLFPSGTVVNQVEARFATTYAPNSYRIATYVIGPDENFGNWAFIFDYDQGAQAMPSMASQRIVGDFQLTLQCPGNNDEVQHWNPEGEMTYYFDVPLPFYTYEMPNFTMYEFSECGTGVAPPPNHEARFLHLGAAFPNPSNSMFLIKINEFDNNLYDIALFDIAGRRVDKQKWDLSFEQTGYVRVNANGLESGNYFLIIGKNGVSNCVKMLLIK